MNEPPLFLAAAVAREIGDEKLLWAASPDSVAYARPRWKGALMGVPFTAFAVFWTWGASGGLSKKGDSAPTFFILWGVMFIFIGLGMLLAPVFAMLKAGRVYYVVTDRRAVIFEKVWSLKIHSFDSSAFDGFERISRGDDRGDLIFRRTIERRGKGTSVTEEGFIGLLNFREAEAALHEMLAKSERKP